jgi:hypothetical protein
VEVWLRGVSGQLSFRWIIRRMTEFTKINCVLLMDVSLEVLMNELARVNHSYTTHP